MKSVLISIRPKWCEKIANGTKTIEVRKTRPKLETPFKCYIYCTNNKDMLWMLRERERPFHENIASRFTAKDVGGATKVNGKVIGEFVCDQITYFGNVATDPWKYLLGSVHEEHKRLITEKACLTEEEILQYKGLYGWHISNLVIYDTPKELSEFRRHDNSYDNAFGWVFEDREKCVPLNRPPQSWCYVEGGEG